MAASLSCHAVTVQASHLPDTSALWAHQASREQLDLKGGPEAAAERLVKETDGGEIKKIELERKHAQPVPGEPGSGMERGSAATVAQVLFLGMFGPFTAHPALHICSAVGRCMHPFW